MGIKKTWLLLWKETTARFRFLPNSSVAALQIVALLISPIFT